MAASTASPRARSRRGASGRSATTAPGGTSAEVCSDERNLAWGEFRNSVADYQVLMGGNRVDYNLDPRVPRGARVLLPRPERLEPGPPDPDELPPADPGSGL